MARSSVMVGAEIAAIEANNKANQNGINKCNNALQELRFILILRSILWDI